MVLPLPWSTLKGRNLLAIFLELGHPKKFRGPLFIPRQRLRASVYLFSSQKAVKTPRYSFYVERISRKAGICIFYRQVGKFHVKKACKKLAE